MLNKNSYSRKQIDEKQLLFFSSCNYVTHFCLNEPNVIRVTTVYLCISTIAKVFLSDYVHIDETDIHIYTMKSCIIYTERYPKT